MRRLIYLASDRFGARAHWLPASLIVGLALWGCSQTRGRARAPSIDASRAGSQAIEMYDKNGDGVISGDELDRVPALKEALSIVDTNNDKGVSAEEITARVNSWKSTKIGIATLRFHVTLNGEPLTGASVTFDPEPFLGDEIRKAVCVTNPYGDASPVIPKELRLDPSEASGAHFGFYKVRISKIVNGKESIPARYNTDTTLGQEIAYDNPAVQHQNVSFNLKSGN